MTFWEVRILHTPLLLPLIDVWQGVNCLVEIALLVLGMYHVWGLGGKDQWTWIVRKIKPQSSGSQTELGSNPREGPGTALAKLFIISMFVTGLVSPLKKAVLETLPAHSLRLDVSCVLSPYCFRK